MTWALALLFTVIFYGLGEVFLKRGFEHLSPWQTYFIDAVLVAAPLWFIYALITGVNFAAITPLIITVSLYVSISYGFYYYVINKGKIGLVSPIIGTYPLYTLFLGFFLLHETVTPIKFVGIILTLLGIFTISFPYKSRLRDEKWVLFALISAALGGVGAYFEKVSLLQVNNQTYIFVLAISQIIVVFLWKLWNKESVPKINLSKHKYTLMGLIIFNIGTITFFYALEKGLAIIVVPLSNTYVAVTVFLSIIWLKEKITPRHILGIAVVLIGIILINYQPAVKNEIIPINKVTPTASSSLTPFPRQKAHVARVIDGDSIVLDDGSQVRYIGINTPEFSSQYVKIPKDDCFAVEAKKTNIALVQNQYVELEKDISETDKFNRLLRYVYVDNISINEFLIRWGFARLETVKPDIRYAGIFTQAQSEAQKDHRGLWGKCP